MISNFLEETDLFIKNNLDKIVNGDYNAHFTEEQIEKLIKSSFLYNHISADNNFNHPFKITFSYFGIKISLNSSDFSFHREIRKEYIIFTLLNDEAFEKAYKIFLRENKINKLCL